MYMDTEERYRAKIYTWRGDTHGGVEHGRYTWKSIAQKGGYI